MIWIVFYDINSFLSPRRKAEQVKLGLGVLNLDDRFERHANTYLNVSTIVVHPEFRQ